MGSTGQSIRRICEKKRPSDGKSEGKTTTRSENRARPKERKRSHEASEAGNGGEEKKAKGGDEMFFRGSNQFPSEQDQRTVGRESHSLPEYEEDGGGNGAGADEMIRERWRGSS